MAKQINKGTSKKRSKVKVDKLPAPAGKLANKEMKNIKGGDKAKQAFEIKDFSFGVENPTTIEGPK